MKKHFKPEFGGLQIFLFLAGLGVIIFILVSNAASFRDNLFNQFFPKTDSQAAETPVRFQSGDLWADKVIGKRDFGEISPSEIVPNKVDNPGGVIVDRSVSPGRLYIWDSGNSRILGVNLYKCYSDKNDNPNNNCTADIVIGQPSGFDFGGCNRDSSYASFPDKKPAGADTLCGMRESTHTTLEEKSFTSMWVDQQGDLYVPDFENNRVLRYIKPFETDQIADQVYGQDDFTGNYCNKSPHFHDAERNNPDFSNGQPAPSKSSICFRSTYHAGAGVTTDLAGNIWVADGGNNRVLRFAPSQKDANLVLGQANFTSGPLTPGNSMNKLSSPTSVRLDSQGRLFVADAGNNRILIFNPPFAPGMNASSVFASNTNTFSLDITPDPNDPTKEVVWAVGNEGWAGRIKLFDMNGTLRSTFPPGEQIGNSGGSIGLDALGNIIAATYLHDRLGLIKKQNDGTYAVSQYLIDGPNLGSTKRLFHPAWAGVAVSGNQLMVADSRILIWNNKNNVGNGQVPDEVITFPPHHGSLHLNTDNAGRIWMLRGHNDGFTQEIAIFNSPLRSTSQPIKTITFPLQTVNGETIAFNRDETKIIDIAISPDSNYVWISLVDSHRVMRIKNPLTNPVVDVVLGQMSLTGKACNRGEIPAPNTGTPLRASLNMLCRPGAMTIDKKGNLYVSDHFLEAEGNFRLLMFAKELFPDNLTSVMFDPNATKEFPRELGFATWEPAFDSTNRMVVGFNPYIGGRFVKYFNDPTRFNTSNRKDQVFAQADGQLKDFYSWPVAATFDSEDNLYMYDANRGQVRIYLNPFNNPISPPPPSNSPSPTPSTSPIAILGDINRDNRVDIFDYNILLTDFGKSDAVSLRSDLNNDQRVDIFDYNVLLTNFGRTI